MTANARSNKVNEPAFGRDSHIEPPWFLGEPHHRALGREFAVDIDLKAHTRVSGYKLSIGPLPVGRVVNTRPCYKPVIAWLDLVQLVGWSAHTHALAIDGVTDA